MPMALCLVVHDLPPAGTEALEAAVWELSESHWVLGTSLLVATGVSPRYLTNHLQRALDQAGVDGTLLATRLSDDFTLEGAQEGGRDWVREHLSTNA
jgi:hypothetical protein